MKFIVLAGVIALTLTACSSDDAAVAEKPSLPSGNAEHVTTNDGASLIKVSVPTIQCESCAKTIRKALKDVEGAGEVDVKVDEKMVFVQVIDNSPAMKAQIEHAISDAGYRTESLDRNADAYESLPDCCKEGAHQN